MKLEAGYWEQKNNKQKTHKHFSGGPCGTIVPGTNPHPSPGTNGTKWRFYCGIKQRKAGLSQGRVPFCPGEGSHLSQGPFLFVPDTVPPKMFMFIGFFLPEIWMKYQVRPEPPTDTPCRNHAIVMMRPGMATLFTSQQKNQMKATLRYAHG